MAKQYRAREGEATAVDTKSQLTTLGSETAPGPLLVPAGCTKLTEIIVAAAAQIAAATGCSLFIRLEGPGLPEGPETLTVGAGAAAVATGSSETVPASKIRLDLPVVATNEILVFGEMAGTDVTQASFGVSLAFE